MELLRRIRSDQNLLFYSTLIIHEMSPMSRINITIPSDLYEECQKTCKKERISFSQLVRNALMNYIQNDSGIQQSEKEIEIEKIVETALNAHLLKINERVSDIENNFYILQKRPKKPSEANPTKKRDKG